MSGDQLLEARFNEEKEKGFLVERKCFLFPHIVELQLRRASGAYQVPQSRRNDHWRKVHASWSEGENTQHGTGTLGDWREKQLHTVGREKRGERREERERKTREKGRRGDERRREEGDKTGDDVGDELTTAALISGTGSTAAAAVATTTRRHESHALAGEVEESERSREALILTSASASFRSIIRSRFSMSRMYALCLSIWSLRMASSIDARSSSNSRLATPSSLSRSTQPRNITQMPFMMKCDRMCT